VIRALVRKIPLRYRRKITDALLWCVQKLAKVQQNAAHSIAQEETKEMEFVIHLSRSTSNSQFEYFDGLDDNAKQSLLQLVFGWDFSEERGVNSWYMTQTSNIVEYNIGYQLIGYVEFKTKAQMVLWKLQHQIKD